MHSSIIRISLPLLAAVGTAFPVAAQSAVVLSPANFRTGAPVPIGADTADAVRVKDGVERIIGVNTWEVARVERDGRAALRVTVANDNYITYLDANTHAPLSSHYHATRDSFDVTIADGRARGWIVWAGQPRREIDETFTVLPFWTDAAERLLGSFPLADGYQAELDVYSPVDGTARNTIRVLGTERLEHRGTMRDVWKVELSRADGLRGPRVFWLDRETGRMLRREHALPDGTRVIMRTR
jgi:hypothetical protein